MDNQETKKKSKYITNKEMNDNMLKYCDDIHKKQTEGLGVFGRELTNLTKKVNSFVENKIALHYREIFDLQNSVKSLEKKHAVDRKVIFTLALGLIGSVLLNLILKLI